MLTPILTKAAETDEKVREAEVALFESVYRSPERRRFRIRIEMFDRDNPGDILGVDHLGFEGDRLIPNNVVIGVECNTGPSEKRGARMMLASEFRSTYNILRIIKRLNLDRDADEMYAAVMMQQHKAKQEEGGKKVLLASAIGGSPR